MLRDLSDKSYNEAKLEKIELIIFACNPKVVFTSEFNTNYRWGGSSQALNDYACVYAVNNLENRNFKIDSNLNHYVGRHNYRVEIKSVFYDIKKTQDKATNKEGKEHVITTSVHNCEIILTLYNLRTGGKKEFKESLFDNSRAGRNLTGKLVVEKNAIHPSRFFERTMSRAIGQLTKYIMKEQ